MAKKQGNNTLIDVNAENIRVYKNGALFDAEKGRIVGMRPDLAETPTLITVSNTTAMSERKREIKTAIARAAAAEAVENDDLRRRYGDDAFFAEIIQAAQRKATNIDDPKMIDAGRFVLKETGYSVDATQPSDTIGAVTDLVRELATFAASMVQAGQDKSE